MAHLVAIEDERGDIVDAAWFCSDSCAKDHPAYAGWNGCVEIHDAPQWCGGWIAARGDEAGYGCGAPLGFYTSAGEWVAPEDQAAWWEVNG